MSELMYKTRGMSNPRGKSRVYFCCHPEDYPLYLEEIAGEILAKQNCAFWYQRSPDGILTEQEKDDLAHMQLFVMPVTKRLLQTKNPALEEFAFAVAHHIPVLPLMREGGLEDLFNRRCGDLQFLDKYANDATAISYDEKLDKFLNSVLVGDELAAKIRAAFDAYVFLSYRKKDRKYAQELMRLIHKNDFCRDIAIWYDEFLTPGENFNDAILTALKKSDLFVLTVTPNLVNEENYIMTAEYPAACQEKKPIVPATMVETDPAALAEKYRGLPPCADASDEEALSKALLEAVRTLALRENDDSPSHNFFIGLAYLSGVDVEVDHARALELIRGAAEAGLEEAIVKLVSMYEKGEGVRRDYEQAAKWLEKLAGLLAQRYRESKKEEDGKHHVQVLTDLGAMVFEMGQFDRAGVIYDLEKRACQDLYDKFGGTYFLRKLAFCHLRLGDIEGRNGRKAQSVPYFEQALVFNRQLVEKEDTAEYRHALSQNLERLGNYYRGAEELAKAEEYYTEMLAIDERGVAEDPSVPARRDLSFSYANLGKFYHLKGEKERALALTEKSFALRKELVEEAPDVLSHKDLAAAYRALGEYWKTEKEYSKSREYYLKAAEWSKIAYEESGSLMLLRSLGLTYDRLASLCRLEEDYEGALEQYRYVMECDKKVAAESRSHRAYRDQSLTLYWVGVCLQKLGRNKEALDYFKRVRKISEAVLRESGAVRDMLDVYDALGKMRMLYEAEDERQGQMACTREKATYAERIWEQDKNLKAVLRATSDYYSVASDAGKCMLKDTNLIKAAYEKVVYYAELGLRSYADADLMKYLFAGAGMLGVLLEKENKKEAAAMTYLRGIRAVSGMLDKLVNERDQKNLSVLVLRLHKIRKLEQAEDIEMLCTVLDYLARCFPDEGDYDKIFAAYGRQGKQWEKVYSQDMDALYKELNDLFK